MKRFTVAVLLLVAVAAFAAEQKLEILKLTAGESENPPLIHPELRPESGRGDATIWTFACPKDESMLLVKQNPGGKTYRCPVDGELMVEGRGRGKMYFYVQ
jgi:hypothetical protein